MEDQETVLNRLKKQVEDQKTLITGLDLKTTDEIAARTTQVAMLQTTLDTRHYQCREGYSSPHCDQCLPGYEGFPSCEQVSFRV